MGLGITGAQWRKSGYSNGMGNCVEAGNGSRAVLAAVPAALAGDPVTYCVGCGARMPGPHNPGCTL